MLRKVGVFAAALLAALLIVAVVALPGNAEDKKPAAAAPAKPAPAARPAAPAAPRISAPVVRSAPAAPRISAPRPAPSAPRVSAPVVRHAPPAVTRQSVAPAATPPAVTRQAQPALRTQQQQQRFERRALRREQAAPQTQIQAQTKTLQQAQPLTRTQENRQIRELQARQSRELRQGKLTRTQRQDLRAQQRQQVQDLRVQQRQQRLQALQSQQAQQATRRSGAPRVTAQQARQGRFAALAQARASNRAARIAARHAWRRGLRAAFVPWYGAVYWPYAYSDIFDYTFWPYAYEDAFWAYAYDDLFEVVFWPSGDPYSGYAYEGPYAGGDSAIASGDPRSRAALKSAEELCRDPGKGVTAWPFEYIERAIKPTAEQSALLTQLKDAAAQAADTFKATCSSEVPMTPAGRLQAMAGRLQATLGAVKIVRPALDAFYESLSDEQKARFNALGPEIGARQAKAARDKPREQQAENCSEAKPGLTGLPIERIEDAVEPTGDQQAAFDRLSEATGKAVDLLQAACPNFIPLTPLGRLEAMEKRLDAMVSAAKIVQPALADFYASLSNEQKARFNALGRETTGLGG